ncbi:MAG: secretin N-terminal domain-containing protein, partial [Thermodesulfobacteriota bacterium]
MKRILPIILFQFICVLLLLSFAEADPEYNIRKHISGDQQLFTIEVRDAEIKDVLRALAQQGGLNIIITEEVQGNVTFRFKDVPLEDALDVILKAHGLGFIIHKNVLWVGSQEELAKTGEGLSTEVFKLNYAEPDKMVAQVKEVLSPVGSVTADLRTNSLIVKDLPDSVEEANKLIKVLDTRTPQVVIEARIVEASSNFSRNLGIQWGGQYTSGSGSNVLTGGSAISASPG